MIARPEDDEGRKARRSRDDRRHNLALRELLDEMVELARHLSNHAPTMSAADLTYARERLEWLAGEIWDQSTRGE